MVILELAILILGTCLLIGLIVTIARIPNKAQIMEKRGWMPTHDAVKYNIIVAAVVIALTLISLFYYVLLG